MAKSGRLPPLNALRAFEAAARNLSFKKAAQELVSTMDRPDPLLEIAFRLEEIARNRDFMCGRYTVVR